MENVASTKRLRHPRSGQAIVIFAVAFAMIAGMLGLVLDGGRIFLEKRRAQVAADAGAVGAVQEMRRGRRDYVTNVRPSAVNDTTLHSYSDANSTIVVNNPPLSGPSVGNIDYVEVIVARNVPTTFMRIFGPETSTVRARAVAGLRRHIDACIIALDPDDSAAIWANGNPTLTAECGIVANSTAADALRTNNTGSQITSTTYIGTAGGASGAGFSPTPQTGMLPVIDPFLNIEPPTGLPAGSSRKVSGIDYYEPGFYRNKIQINNGTAVFRPGLYVLKAGMKITGGTVSGTEVFFYNQNNNGNSYIDIAGAAVVNLSAPTSGDYQGMLFMGPRDGRSGNPGNKIARGDSNSSYEGTLYFPSEHLDWAGNASTSTAWGMVVANTLNISGTADAQVVRPPTEGQAPRTYRMEFAE